MLIKILVCLIAELMVIIIGFYIFDKIEVRKKKREWKRKAEYRIIERKTKDGKNAYYIVAKKDMRGITTVANKK